MHHPIRSTRLRGAVALAVGAALAFGVASPAGAFPNMDETSRRSGGLNRWETSVQVAQRFFDLPNVDAIFIASGENYPDALVAGAAAGLVGAPLLLVEKNAVPGPVMELLKHMGQHWGHLKHIYIVGGPAVISSSVRLQLAPFGALDELYGSNRYQTAIAVSQEFWPDGAGRVHVATGEDFADALAASATAGDWSGPVLLTNPNNLQASVAAELERLDPNTVSVVGGPAAVSEHVVGQITTLGRPVHGHNWETRRIGGSNRYGTAALLATTNWDNSHKAFLALGTKYPDALLAAPAAIVNGPYPLLLTAESTLPTSTAEALLTMEVCFVEVVGGAAVIHNSVREQIDDLIRNSDYYESRCQLS